MFTLPCIARHAPAKLVIWVVGDEVASEYREVEACVLRSGEHGDGLQGSEHEGIRGITAPGVRHIDRQLFCAEGRARDKTHNAGRGKG